ncbi:MAG TPA: hypothetical protein VHO24_12040 [Opitutaceae bacterium]|nr:hypothetical protein [Opitutaceae bacterium]
MKKLPFDRALLAALFCACALGFTGCTTAGGTVADLGLAAAGGTAGYHVSDHKIGGAAVGAAAGFVASKVAQSKVRDAIRDAEKRGFDQAMNQAVKQQYWIIQNQQRSREISETQEARLVPVVIPETKINGVLQKAHVEYLRVEP